MFLKTNLMMILSLESDRTAIGVFILGFGSTSTQKIELHKEVDCKN